MAGKWKSFGKARIIITSADPQAALHCLTGSGVILTDIVYESELSVRCEIPTGDFKRVNDLLKGRGDNCQTAKYKSIKTLLQRLLRRWVMVAGVLLLTGLTVLLPQRILFAEVQGNDALEAQDILTVAENAGLTFGCSRKQFRSETVKQALLENIPQLEWVGVTTTGCVATVAVREKAGYDRDALACDTVGNIVAATDGLIRSVTATRGEALCQPGQAVYQGQILICGYRDCGRVTVATQAQGEVYADTIRQFQGISPDISLVRGELISQRTVYGLQIGKKLIKFSKDSGISPATCVKMYEQRYVTLPGGFRLPIAFVRENISNYDIVSAPGSHQDSLWLSGLAEQYVFSQLQGGFVHWGDIRSEYENGIYTLCCTYSCNEQIGKIMIEERLKKDE